MTDEMMRRRTKLMPLWRNTPFAAPVYRPPQNPRVVPTLLDGELAVVAAFMRISSELRMTVMAIRQFLGVSESAVRSKRRADCVRDCGNGCWEAPNQTKSPA